MATQEERDRMLAEYLAVHGSDEDHLSASASESDDDDHFSEDAPMLTGMLSQKCSDRRILFSGHAGDDNFSFASNNTKQWWDCYNPTCSNQQEQMAGQAPPPLRTIEMVGRLGRRQLEVTLHVTAEAHLVALPAPLSFLQQQANQSGDTKVAAVEEEAEEKKDSSDGVFDVTGRGQEMNGGPLEFEFFGSIHRDYMDMGFHLNDPLETGQVPIDCHVNIISKPDSKLPPVKMKQDTRKAPPESNYSVSSFPSDLKKAPPENNYSVSSFPSDLKQAPSENYPMQCFPSELKKAPNSVAMMPDLRKAPPGNHYPTTDTDTNTRNSSTTRKLPPQGLEYLPPAKKRPPPQDLPH
jgi:hypothetical protein